MHNKKEVQLMLEKMLDEKVITINDLDKMFNELKTKFNQENPKGEKWMYDERQKLVKSIDDGLSSTGKIIEGAWDYLVNNNNHNN